MAYRGRFAPSATGPLHAGSIFAALLSFCHARHAGGQWVIRIDDLDSLRCKPEYARDILSCLHAFALSSDAPPAYQSDRLAHYESAFSDLKRQGLLYACTCTRKELPRDGYPGTCRFRLGQPLSADCAIRLDTSTLSTEFKDLFRGPIQSDAPGDFIVRRRDGLFAYQLACAVDEALDRITHVIRGYDLIQSTPMQRHVATLCQLETPEYGHFPVLTDQNGHKLSKQTFAQAVDPTQPGDTFSQIARHLLLKDTPKARAKASVWIDYFIGLGDPVDWLPTESTLCLAE